MDDFPFITFLSDYGSAGGYVAACELTIAAVAPSVRVVHLTHAVDLADVAGGGRILARSAPLGPIAVHLAVVDPGVGTGRRAITLVTGRGDLLVGPDNGLLIGATETLGGVVAVWELSPPEVRTRAGLDPDDISSTFHGRDVFAPAAALLARGYPAGDLGVEVEPDSLVVLPPPLLELTEAAVHTQVVEVDRWGNVALSLDLRALEPRAGLVEVLAEGEETQPIWRARHVSTFAELVPGELGLLQDSWGHASLSLNWASAAELLGLEPGDVLWLRLPDEGSPR